MDAVRNYPLFPLSLGAVSTRHRCGLVARIKHPLCASMVLLEFGVQIACLIVPHINTYCCYESMFALSDWSYLTTIQINR